MAWQLNGVTLDYGPSFQDDMELDNMKNIELSYPSKDMRNSYIFLKNYDFPKTMTWETATSSLKDKLIQIPKFTNIPFYDNISGNNYTVQIISRTITPKKTIKNSEILWTISLKIRIIS